MARIRTLKPEIWMSPQVMNLSHGARLLFLGLITQADDEGRGVADARKLKAAIFGGDDITSTDVRRWLDEIETQRLAVMYEDVSHGTLYELPSWKAHQSIDRPRKSAYPSSNEPNKLSQPRRTLDESRTSPREGSDPNGSDLKGREGNVPLRARDHDSQNGHDRDGGYALTTQVKAVYPAGTYGQENWILAERAISKLLDAGERADEILALTRAFAAQQDAKGSTGSQFVKSPENFFGNGFWRGPFPIPQAPSQKRMRTAQEIAAAYPEDAA